MLTVLQPVLGALGYSPHLSVFDIALNLLFALLAVLFIRLFRFTWPQMFLLLFVSGFVSFFGDPHLVLHAISCVCALGAVVMSGYLFATRRKRPKQEEGRFSKTKQWIAVVVLYLILAYVVAYTIVLERRKKQLVQNGLKPLIHKLDLTLSSTSPTKRIAFGGFSVAIPSAGITGFTNRNGMILQALYDDEYTWWLQHPRRNRNFLDSLRKDSDTGFPL